jgi:DNA-directed RNA polymerase specialized sigma24 family protein
VLTLRYYLDLSEVQIAAALSISPGSVKAHAHRGLAALRSDLEVTS